MVKMTSEEFKSYVLKELNLDLSNDILKKLEIYADFLLEYNEHTNLTAIKTKEEVYLKHFFDSLTLTKIATFTNENLLDVGTGAGFPGLVLAIVFPNLNVTLLDSNNKKTTFLEGCVKKIALNNVNIVNCRAEDYTKIHREEYDYVTSRAVAQLRILLELNIPAIKVSGKFLVMKGNIEKELDEAKQAINILNCKIIKEISFELANDKGHRTLLSIEKLKKTDKKYPRTYDKIKKKALK